MNYLVIDNTMTRPIRGVYCPDIRAVQSTRALPGQEIKAYAQWIGLNGGRALLDAFELQLINDGVLHIAPHDEDGFAHPGLCEAIETFRTDEGLRIIWQVKTRCRACRGKGHFRTDGGLVEDEDLCLNCEEGFVYEPEVVTDMDGLVVPDEA